MLTFILVLFLIITITNIGLLFDYFVLKAKRVHLAYSFGFGLTIITLITLGMSFFNLRVNHNFILVISLLSYVPYSVSSSVRSWIKSNTARLLVPTPSKTLILVCILFLSLLVFSTLIWGHDAYTFWLSKARAFWLDEGITGSNLFAYWPFDQPLLWPIVSSWFYHFLGNETPLYIKVIPLTTYLLLVYHFWLQLRPGPNRVLWVGLLSLTPFLWGNLVLPEYSGNADLLVCFFLFLGLSNLISQRSLIYSSLFFGSAILIKNDSYPLLLGFILLLPLFKSKLQSAEQKNYKVAWILAVLFVLGTLFWKQWYGLSNRFVEQDLAQVVASRSIIEYNLYTTHAFREEFRQTYRWGIGWWIIGISLIIGSKHLFRQKQLLFAACLLTIQIIGLYYVYYITVEDQASHITSSIFRVILQLYPSALLLAHFLLEPEKALIKKGKIKSSE